LLINKLSTYPDTFSIRVTKTGAVMVADDLATTPISPGEQQSLIASADQNTSCETQIQSKSSTLNIRPEIILNGTPVGS
jgi:hypothetical protein